VLDIQNHKKAVEHCLGYVATQEEHATQNGNRETTIVDGNTNKQVIRVYSAGAQGILSEDVKLLQIPLQHFIEGTRAYKNQWLESMVVAKQKYQKKQEARMME